MLVRLNTIREILKYLLITGFVNVIIVSLLLFHLRPKAIQKAYKFEAEHLSDDTRISIQMLDVNKRNQPKNKLLKDNDTEVYQLEISDEPIPKHGRVRPKSKPPADDTVINKLKIPDDAAYSPRKSNTKCKKKTNIAFLKTHKAGSTTVSNILTRFGINHDLNFLLPRHSSMADSFWVIKSDSLDKSSLIPLKANEVYNLITVHTKYRKEEYDRVMPHGYSTLGIIREPEDYFVSAMFYFYPLKINQTNFPFIFDNFFLSENTFRKQVEDFGIEDTRFPDKLLMSITNVINTFDFVILLEYFDESLVYLRRKFCWDLQDVLYIVQNKNIMRHGYALRPEHRNRLLDILRTDYILYNKFKEKFWDLLSKEGADLFLEVHHFKTMLRSVKDFCKYGHLHSDFPLVVRASLWNDQFTLNVTQCHLMTMKEPEMVENLMKRAWKKYTS